MKHYFPSHILIGSLVFLSLCGCSVSRTSASINVLGREMEPRATTVISQSNYIDINWYKRKGNTFSDAFIQALDDAHKYNKPVYIPEGEYEIIGVDINYDNIVIYGDGSKKSIIKNPAWGMWNFRSSSNNLIIHDIGCAALEVNNNTRHESATEERDNAASFILYKGNNGEFYNIYGSEIQCLIWLGGDYIKTQRYGNVVHDIETKNTSFAVCASHQSRMKIYNIKGNAKQMIGLNENGNEKIVGPAAHLLYLTGVDNYDSEIYDIVSLENYHDNGGSVWGCSFKGLHNCYIHDVVVYENGVVFERIGKNNVVENMTIYGAGYNISGANLFIHIPVPDKEEGILFKNIKIIGGRVLSSGLSVSFDGLTIDNRKMPRNKLTGYMAKFDTSKGKKCRVILSNINILCDDNQNKVVGLVVGNGVSGRCHNYIIDGVATPYSLSPKFSLKK